MNAGGDLARALVLALCASLGVRGANAQDDAAALAGKALARLGGAKIDALERVTLDFDEYAIDAKGKPVLVARYGATLAYPDRFRLELRHPKRGNRVFLVEGTKRSFGAAGGPFAALGGPKADEVDAMFRLLGALLCWDLRPPDGGEDTRELAVADGELASVARWDRMAKPEALRRRVDPETGRVERLRCGGREFRLRGRLEEGVGAFCGELRELGGKRLLRFWRIGTGWTFVDERFRPASRPAKGAEPAPAIERGAERHNFDAVVFARVPEAFVVTLDDPGRWAARLFLLDRLGMDLYRLEQQPVGLPDYGVEGKMRVAFVPSKKGGRPRVPEGLRFARRRAGLAAVLYATGTLSEAKKSLGERLEAFAKEHGLAAAAPLRVFPYVLPRPGQAPPKAGDRVLVRAELLVR